MIPKHALYVREKLSTAIRKLATHPGKIKDRLGYAAADLLRTPKDGLPDYDAVANDIAWIHVQLTSRDETYEGEGRLAATLRSMRAKQAADIVDRVILAHAKLDYFIAGGKP